MIPFSNSLEPDVNIENEWKTDIRPRQLGRDSVRVDQINRIVGYFGVGSGCLIEDSGGRIAEEGIAGAEICKSLYPGGRISCGARRLNTKSLVDEDMEVSLGMVQVGG